MCFQFPYMLVSGEQDQIQSQAKGGGGEFAGDVCGGDKLP